MPTEMQRVSFLGKESCTEPLIRAKAAQYAHHLAAMVFLIGVCLAFLSKNVQF